MPTTSGTAEVRHRVLAAPQPVRGRRLTQARVAAVCLQLGDNLTVRNVQRVLGGSLRDIAPKVRTWRNTVLTTLAEDSAPPTADQHWAALGSFVRTALNELNDAAEARHEDLLQQLAHKVSPASSLDGALRKRLDGIQSRLEALPTSAALAKLQLGVEALVSAGATRDRQLETALKRLDEVLSITQPGAQPPLVLPAGQEPNQEAAEQRQALDRRLAELGEVIAGQQSLLRDLLVADRRIQTPAEVLEEILQHQASLAAGIAALRQDDRGLLALLTAHTEALGDQLTALRQDFVALRPVAKKRAVRRKASPSTRKKGAPRAKKKVVTRKASSKPAASTRAAKRKSPRRTTAPTTARNKNTVAKKRAPTSKSRSPARSLQKSTGTTVRKKTAKSSPLGRTASTPRKVPKRTKPAKSTSRRSTPQPATTRPKSGKVNKALVRSTVRTAKTVKPTKKAAQKIRPAATIKKTRTRAQASAKKAKPRTRR